MLSKWVVFDQHVFCSYICSACRFEFLIKKNFFRNENLTDDCIRPEMFDNIKSVLCTSSLLLFLSDFSH